MSLAVNFREEQRKQRRELRGHYVPRSTARASTAFLVLDGNTFGLLAPIVTGYVVAATGSFNTAFAVAGGLALVGAVAAVGLVRGTLGEHVRPPRASPRLAS